MISPEPTIQILSHAARALRSPSASVTDELRAIQAAQDALEALKVDRVAALEESEGHRDEGSSTVAAWGRLALRQDSAATKAMLRAARTLRDLPLVAEAARGGQISFEHVKVFSYALTHIGPGVVVPAQEWLVDVARTCEPSLLFAKVKELRAAAFPDDLDEAWARGMAKQDLTIAQTIDGWFVRGFLGVETGAKLHTLLQSLSAPRDADDVREAAERRVDALDGLLDSVLASGLPADNGIRPHLDVIVDSETLRRALTPAAFTPDPGEPTIPGLPGVAAMATKPAHLVGFGPVGRQMLSYLTCQADLTPMLVASVEANSEILDVGRSSRLATARQRRAIRVRQMGLCATPGCTHPIQHVHHILWWSRDDGPTDLESMTGLCGSCHRLVHREKLIITIGDDGPEFANARGRPLRGRDDLRTLKTLSRYVRRRSFARAA